MGNTDTVTGTDVLRSALRARIKHGHAAPLARDLNIGTASLDEFAHGKAKLPDTVMTALAKEFFGPNCWFDRELNLLVRAKQAVKPMHRIEPPPVRRAPPPPGPVAWRPTRPLTPQPVQTKRTAPGWAD